MESLIFKNVKSLVRRDWNNVDVHCRDSKRSTLLHHIILVRNERESNVSFKVSGIDPLDLIESLVALGADVNAKNHRKMTPLHHAVLKNDTESIECLLKLGADINAQYQEGVTSLSEAIRLKNVQAVRVLAQLGLAQSVGYTYYRTVLTSQLFARNINMLKYLVYNGANINATVNMVSILQPAIKSGNIEIVQILLDNGAAVNSGEALVSNTSIVMESLRFCDVTDPAWFTDLKNLGADFNLPFTISFPIYEAVLSGRLGIMELLIKYKADIKCADRWTPNALTLSRKQFGLLEHMMKCGADINARYEPKCHPIVAACRNGNIDIVKALGIFQIDKLSTKGFTLLFHRLLIQIGLDTSGASGRLENATAITKLISLGANVNFRFDTYCELTEAVVRGDFRMVEELAKLGANCNGYALNCTLLTYWLNAHKEDVSTDSQIYNDILRSLVEAGADLDVQCENKLLLLLAVESSDTEMVKTLARLGVGVNIGQTSHLKPIHRAVLFADTAGAVDTLDLLIEHGADPKAEYFGGFTPLHAALESKNTEMVELLLQLGAKPIVGTRYHRYTAFSSALEHSNYDAMRYLTNKGSADVSAATEILTGFIQPIDQETADIVAHFNLKTAKITSETILSWYIRLGGNKEGIETLLSLKINRSSGRNVFQNDYRNGSLIQTDLHVACRMCDLDIVRLMIINGSDVNKLDSDGLPPLAYLPLAPIINYRTLQETKTKNVIEKIRFEDFIPLGTTFENIDSLVSEPGIGDVHNITQLNVDKIHEDVEKVILSLVELCQILPGTSPWIKACGSAAEGTKVGIPDEMDFLAVVGSIDQNNIQNSKYDYVHCTNLPNKESGQFHISFMNKMRDNIHHIRTSECLHFAHPHCQSQRINKSGRKATTPFKLLWKEEQSYDEIIPGCLLRNTVDISIDVVPSIHVKNWPEGAIEKTWLLNLDELKSHGYFIVPKPPHVKSALAGEFTDKELCDMWKISFPHLETYHMQRLDKRVKDVYLLAKCMRNPDVCRVMVTDNGSYPRSTEKYVTSYMLKMIFFKNVEYFLSSNLGLGEMVCRVYDELVESLTHGFIPLYFMPHVSAVAGHDIDLAKSARAAKILKTFVHACYSSDCQGATGDSAESRDQNQSKSVYQSIEIG